MPIDPETDTWRIFRIMAEFVEGFHVMGRVGPAVTIFGSARTHHEDRHYKAAEAVARKLANSGLSIITGGGPGIMEAGNKGAFDTKAHSVGMNITLPQEQQGNRYQNLSLDFHYFYARKVMLVKYASAFVYFPGGFGTLDEFFEVLTLVQTLKVQPYPIVLFGSEYWTGLIEWIEKQLNPNFIDGEDMLIFKITDDVDECVKLVQEGIKSPWWHPEEIPSHVADKIPDTAVDAPVQTQTPLSGDIVEETGEGTRYGKRPQITENAHAKPQAKPPQ